jgi:TonB family protein
LLRIRCNPLGIAIATSTVVEWKHAHLGRLAFIGAASAPRCQAVNREFPDSLPDTRRSLLCLVLAAPRLPERRRSMRAGGGLSLLIHAGALAALLLAGPLWRSALPAAPTAAAAPIANRRPAATPRIVFLQTPRPGGGGGGGGGNRQPAPPSRAQAIGRDRMTVPAARRAVVAPRAADAPPPQQVVLDAKPLASGTALVIGAPDAAPWLPFSQGPGWGGGVGEGTGSGIGAGTGPGMGAGSGGGFGGGVYRPGGAVVPPVLVKEVKPVYTPEALRQRIQGSVLLEAIVGTDGIPVGIRVTRPLERGLDEAAVAAAGKWRFAPGRVGDSPVDVLITIQMDFRVH